MESLKSFEEEIEIINSEKYTNFYAEISIQKLKHLLTLVSIENRGFDSDRFINAEIEILSGVKKINKSTKSFFHKLKTSLFNKANVERDKLFTQIEVEANKRTNRLSAEFEAYFRKVKNYEFLITELRIREYLLITDELLTKYSVDFSNITNDLYSFLAFDFRINCQDAGRLIFDKSFYEIMYSYINNYLPDQHFTQRVNEYWSNCRLRRIDPLTDSYNSFTDFDKDKMMDTLNNIALAMNNNQQHFTKTYDRVKLNFNR